MISEDINSPEAFNWKIALALMVAWVLVYMCMIKGIASSGKVSIYDLLYKYPHMHRVWKILPGSVHQTEN
jgi:solute carrier family 6 amino acid/orphan transporter-like 15/16/17/18/20